AGRIRTVTAMTTTTEAMDPAAVEAFAGRIFGLLTDGMLVYMVDVGHRTGLIDALAEGPGTSDDIADRAGLNERYVREWLGALVHRRDGRLRSGSQSPMPFARAAASPIPPIAPTSPESWRVSAATGMTG